MFKLMTGNLARAYYSAYCQNGQIEDLNKALRLMRQLLVDLHSGRFDYINIIAQMLRMRFEALHEVEDLEQSVLYYHEAISLLPTLDDQRRTACAHMVHTGLAATYTSRFDAFARLEDLEDSIAQYLLAVNLGPQSDGNYAHSVSGLAKTLITRFERLRQISDLTSAVSCIRISLQVLEATDPLRKSLLFTLANSLLQCFDHTEDLDDLEEAIILYRAVIAARPEGHPGRPSAIGNLAMALHSRYKRLNEMVDLSSAISLHEEALALLPETRQGRSSELNNLASALSSRFEKLGNPRDLEKSIEYCRDALLSDDLDDSGRAMSLINLGGLLSDSFTHNGRFSDLDDGIARLAKQQDLEGAIDFSRQNLDLHQSEHSERAFALAAYAGILLRRFQSFGLVEDLTEVISCHRQALELCPEKHSRRSESSVEDLESALFYHTLTLSLRPDGHPDRAASLRAVAESYSALFKEYGRMQDLDAAIGWDREALGLRPQGHARRFQYLNDLAVDLVARFDKLGNFADLEEAIELIIEAMNSMPETLPAHSRLGRHLAIAHLKQHAVKPSADLLTKAFALFEAAFNHTTVAPGDAVQTLLDWSSAARKHGVRIPLQAYSRALTLLDQTVAVNATIDFQQKALAAPGAPRTIALDAAALAIENGAVETAVELLEQGRAMLWTRMRGYRSALDQLHDADPDLAAQFDEVSKQLDLLATSLQTGVHGNKENARDFDRKMKAQRVLQEKWDELVCAIRQLGGEFANFLQPLPFEALRAAAEGGPVILVNVSECRCDAVILQDVGPPVLVPLPNMSLDGLQQLHAQFLKARERPSPKPLIQILRTLWNSVVEPIVERLLELEVPKNTRIWWCPTSFLCGFPLHAAGMYTQREPNANLPNLFISSYTPTLSALIHARSNARRFRPNVQVLVIGQSNEELPAVAQEIEQVKKLGHFVNMLTGAGATRARHSYIHFACHAQQNREPFKSSLLDLIQAHLPNADLAFLSACSTATGDAHTPDEFAGFRSVDTDGPFVTREFYDHMFREGEGIAQFSDAAVALHGATRALRKKEPLSVNRWINFIHVGA
ncbi:hypothetical protein B0H10DRAFT_2005169 [Mycena sp. CBHHK59/15]|nr:hypothetical protein B0H10DRAFT_2005169 [Mycena sp. CBHHK59/15]